MESIFILIIYFSICSFLGWIIQNIFGFITERKFKTAHFLYGPFVPIYGFVALIIYFYNFYFQNFPLIIKLISYFVIPITIEYTTFYLLKKIFNLKLWDYSKYKFNFHGSICLGIGIIWFLLVLLGVLVIQPFFIGILQKLPWGVILGLSVTLIIYFVIDASISIKRRYDFSKIKSRLIRSK